MLPQARIVPGSPCVLPVVRLDKRKHVQGTGLDALKLALNGGDDYELLFTVSPSTAKRLPRSLYGLPLTPIGKITRSRKLLLRDADGYEQMLIPAGWDAFRPKT